MGGGIFRELFVERVCLCLPALFKGRARKGKHVFCDDGNARRASEAK